MNRAANRQDLEKARYSRIANLKLRLFLLLRIYHLLQQPNLKFLSNLHILDKYYESLRLSNSICKNLKNHFDLDDYRQKVEYVLLSNHRNMYL
jgi:hypothetical protein